MPATSSAPAARLLGGPPLFHPYRTPATPRQAWRAASRFQDATMQRGVTTTVFAADSPTRCLDASSALDAKSSRLGLDLEVRPEKP
jgi:hypothetical protein